MGDKKKPDGQDPFVEGEDLRIEDTTPKKKEKHLYQQLDVSGYLWLVEEAEQKYEYDDGFLRAMAGGSIGHGMICGNIYFGIRDRLPTHGHCTVFNSDVRLRVEETNSFFYPDVFAVCGDLEVATEDPNSLLNPCFVVEVLSPSTEARDRGTKFHQYCHAASFREYLLVDQVEPGVDQYILNDEGVWEVFRYTRLRDEMWLVLLGISLRLRDIYAGVPTVDHKDAYDMFNDPIPKVPFQRH